MNEANWHEARLTPIPSVRGEDERERWRAAAAPPAVLTSVRESGRKYVWIGGLVALLLAATFGFQERASAEDGLRTSENAYVCDPELQKYLPVTFIHGGYVWHGYNCGGVAEVVRALDDNPIGADAPTPTVISRRINSDGSVSTYGVYQGEQGIESGPKPPAANQPISVPHGVLYQADARNRAVQHEGNCYREWLSTGGVWRRSTSYGSNSENCVLAAWNAYQRSQGLPLFPLYGTDSQPATTPPGFTPSEPLMEE